VAAAAAVLCSAYRRARAVGQPGGVSTDGRWCWRLRGAARHGIQLSSPDSANTGRRRRAGVAAAACTGGRDPSYRRRRRRATAVTPTDAQGRPGD